MAVFKCKMCGAPLNIEENETVIKCEYCQQPQTLPKLNDEKRVQMYDRANHFRRNNEFDKAAAIYEQILLEDNTDAETYWSLVLCRYGIEYVKDPATGKRMPTVNRAQFTSIYDDDNYRSAIEYADVLQRSLYEEEAKTINEIQKGILAISQKEEPFDIFICYKETGADGRRTPDSVLATELYQQLTREGFKVFFSRITLESKLGTAYEPYIFAALNSAKVMVVIGTKPEYFNAVWVKNEWSRYLSLIKNGAEKLLIPAYRDMDPYDLPEEFSHLQAQDMGKLGFMQDLTYGITKIVRPKTAQQTVVVESAQSNNSNVTALLKRAFMFLEDKDWHSASEYCEKVLDIEPENAEAYLAKLMVELKVNVRERLNTCEQPFNRSTNYIKAVRFGSPALKEELDGYNREIANRNNDIAYKKAMSLMEQADSETLYKNAAEAFRKIASYRDSDVLAKQCFDRAEVCRKDRIYEEATNRMQNDSIASYEKAINGFNLIRGWKDSDSQIIICKESMNALIYAEAIEAMNIQSVIGYDTAIKNFSRISGWKDADEQLETCTKRKQALLKNATYEAATELMRKDTNNSYHSAIEKFREIPGWRDADELIKICERRIEASKAKAEAERIAKEKAEERERKAKKRKKITKKLISFVIVLAIISGIGFAVVYNVYFKPIEQYNEAVELFEAGKYDEAYELVVNIKKSDAVELTHKIINDRQISELKGIKVGKIINFGVYRVDDISKGSQISEREWLVLDVVDGKALIVEITCFEDPRAFEGDTWKESGIREYLNGEFITNNFSKEQITLIEMSEILTLDEHPGEGAFDYYTEDKVFLLGKNEVELYLPEKLDRFFTGGNWWLRTHNSSHEGMLIVDDNGKFNWREEGIKVAYRPAMWIDLVSE